MPTTDPDRMREQFIKSPYLLIDCAARSATLASKSEMLKALGDNAFVVTHALGAYHALAKIVGGQQTFSLTEIAKVAGVDYHSAHFWLREEVIVASIRPREGSGRGRGPVFSFCDAVAAGIVGSLRRQNLGLEIVRLVAPLFAEPKKRTARRIAPAKRS